VKLLVSFTARWIRQKLINLLNQNISRINWNLVMASLRVDRVVAAATDVKHYVMYVKNSKK
jgi:hypothetical protein